MDPSCAIVNELRAYVLPYPSKITPISIPLIKPFKREHDLALALKEFVPNQSGELFYSVKLSIGHTSCLFNVTRKKCSDLYQALVRNLKASVQDCLKEKLIRPPLFHLRKTAWLKTEREQLERANEILTFLRKLFDCPDILMDETIWSFFPMITPVCRSEIQTFAAEKKAYDTEASAVEQMRRQEAQRIVDYTDNKPKTYLNSYYDLIQNTGKKFDCRSQSYPFPVVVMESKKIFRFSKDKLCSWIFNCIDTDSGATVLRVRKVKAGWYLEDMKQNKIMFLEKQNSYDERVKIHQLLPKCIRHSCTYTSKVEFCELFTLRRKLSNSSYMRTGGSTLSSNGISVESTGPLDLRDNWSKVMVHQECTSSFSCEESFSIIRKSGQHMGKFYRGQEGFRITIQPSQEILSMLALGIGINSFVGDDFLSGEGIIA